MEKQCLSHIEMANFDNMCYMLDIETYELLYLNETVANILGLGVNKAIGHKCYEILQGNSDICSFCNNKKLIKDEFYKCEFCSLKSQIHYEFKDVVIEFGGKKVRLGFAMDISDKKNKLAALQNKIALDETLIKCVQTLAERENMNIAIDKLLSIVCKFYKADRAYIFELNENVLYIDNTYEWNNTNVEPHMQQLQKLPVEILKPWFDKFETDGEFSVTSLSSDVDFNAAIYKILESHGINSLMLAPLRLDGSLFGFFGVDNPMYNINDITLLRSVSLFIVDDIQKKKVIKELEKLSYMDELADVYNRRKYIQTINKIGNGESTSIGIIYLDINGLKQVNDEYGHEYGDRLILKTVTLLKAYFSNNNLFRIGGDEFIGFYMGNNQFEFSKSIARFRDLLKSERNISISVGSTWCSDSKNIAQQIAYAEELMYIDKQFYYGDSQNTQTNYRANIASDLRKSISKDEFFVVLQPKITLADEKLAGAEALIRKKDVSGAIISPDKFIAIYEADGIIRYLDFFVLETVCKLLQKWKDRGHRLIPISVNFSRITILEYNIAQSIRTVCKKYDVEPQFIKIELTEGISNIMPKVLAEILNKIKYQGFEISLDDFGIEYSNLAVLTSIEFDEIKLDKSIINDISDSLKSRNVVKCIVDMCNCFENTKTVAEGIETYEQLEILKEYNCILGQGYYFSKPISIEQFTQQYLL